MCMRFSELKLGGFGEVEKVLELPTDTSCLEFRGIFGKQLPSWLEYISMIQMQIFLVVKIDSKWVSRVGPFTLM